VTLIWHDHEKEKRLRRSQPLQIDWLVFWTWISAALLGCAWLYALYILVRQTLEAL